MGGSRYGGANPNNIGATGKIVTSRPGTNQTQTDKLPANVVQQGSGPYIVDVRYDESTRKIIVTRGDIEGDSIDGPRMGRVMHACTYQTPDQIAAYVADYKWFPLLSGTQDVDWENSPLLPDDFEHVDGFSESTAPVKNLKEIAGGCLAFVRLLPGSSPLGQSRWDADLTAFGHVGAASADRRPRCVKAIIKTRETGSGSEKVHSVISLYFDASVDLRFQQYGTEIIRRIQVTTNKGPLKASSATQGSAANVIDVTLLRPITRDEKVFVQVLDGVFTSGEHTNVASEVLTATELLPKACYVIVVNRSSEAALAAGDVVQVGKPLTLYDEDRVPLPVYDCIPYGSGGGVELYYGMVLGGNPLASGSNVRQFLNPVPMFNEDKSAVNITVIPDDWSDLDLPVGWDVADSFTADQETPNGLGYVQLLRPSDWGGKSWVSAFALPVNPGGWSETDPPTVLEAIYQNEASLQIFWSHGVVAVPTTQVLSKILLSVTSAPPVGTAPLPALRILSATAASKKIAATLNRAVATYETVTLSVLGGLWKTSSIPAIPNAPQTFTAYRAAPLGAVVMAISKVSLQGFVSGDFVVMADMGSEVTDALDVTRPVLDILYPINPQRLPHSHQTFGNGPLGGGPANLNFAGTVNIGATA